MAHLVNPQILYTGSLSGGIPEDKVWGKRTQKATHRKPHLELTDIGYT